MRPGDHPKPEAAKLPGVTSFVDPKVLKIIVDAFKEKVLIIRTKFRGAVGVSESAGNGTARSPISRDC